jgi:hypothetical protein
MAFDWSRRAVGSSARSNARSDREGARDCNAGLLAGSKSGDSLHHSITKADSKQRFGDALISWVAVTNCIRSIHVLVRA